MQACTQYWPEKLNISETYGDFEVTMKDQQQMYYIVLQQKRFHQLIIPLMEKLAAEGPNHLLSIFQ